MFSQPKGDRTRPGIPVLLFILLPRGSAVEDSPVEYNKNGMLAVVKSFSRVRLFATPWPVACTRLLRPWDFLELH